MALKRKARPSDFYFYSHRYFQYGAVTHGRTDPATVKVVLLAGKELMLDLAPGHNNVFEAIVLLVWHVHRNSNSIDGARSIAELDMVKILP